jgi:hypothetical protein
VFAFGPVCTTYVQSLFSTAKYLANLFKEKDNNGKYTEEKDRKINRNPKRKGHTGQEREQYLSFLSKLTGSQHGKIKQ